jgi:hypothetical protein
MKDLIAQLWKKLRWPKKPSVALTVVVSSSGLLIAAYVGQTQLSWPEWSIAVGAIILLTLWTIKRMVLHNEHKYGREPRYILRAKPGPGIDLVIRPVRVDMQNEWRVVGRTEAGRNFVNALCVLTLNRRELDEIKGQATRFRLTFETIMQPPIYLEPRFTPAPIDQLIETPIPTGGQSSIEQAIDQAIEALNAPTRSRLANGGSEQSSRSRLTKNIAPRSRRLIAFGALLPEPKRGIGSMPCSPMSKNMKRAVGRSTFQILVPAAGTDIVEKSRRARKSTQTQQPSPRSRSSMPVAVVPGGEPGSSLSTRSLRKKSSSGTVTVA